MGGSSAVESLTDSIETGVMEHLKQIEEAGGTLRAIETSDLPTATTRNLATNAPLVSGPKKEYRTCLRVFTPMPWKRIRVYEDRSGSHYGQASSLYFGWILIAGILLFLSLAGAVLPCVEDGLSFWADRHGHGGAAGALDLPTGLAPLQQGCLCVAALCVIFIVALCTWKPGRSHRHQAARRSSRKLAEEAHESRS
jgi:hypothetical protein